MGFRFRKRVKLAPGVHLNLGTKSASVSVGPRGAKLNIGKNGTRATAGIPGTGISYSQKITGRAEGGQAPSWARIFKILMWFNIIFWGVILLIWALAKS